MDKESKEIKYTNFGFQIPPLLIKAGTIQKLGAADMPISTAVEFSTYEFIEESFSLEVGDKLIATTDGLVEEKKNGQMYGLGRLKEIVKENLEQPTELLLQKIDTDFKDFLGTKEPQDDVSILALNREEVIDKLEFEIASEYQFLDKAKEKFKTFVEKYYSETEMLAIGFHEMLINAIEHGNLGQGKQLVEIMVVITSDYIKLKVDDTGKGFDWQDKLEKELNYSDFSERGRGISITRKIWDKIIYNSPGNKVVLYQFFDDVST